MSPDIQARADHSTGLPDLPHETGAVELNLARRFSPAAAIVAVGGAGGSYRESRQRCCQSNANPSPKHPKSRCSGRKLTPLSQDCRAVLSPGRLLHGRGICEAGKT